MTEGVETPEEYQHLRACGVRYMQGYLLGKPQLEPRPCTRNNGAMPEVTHAESERMLSVEEAHLFIIDLA